MNTGLIEAEERRRFAMWDALRKLEGQGRALAGAYHEAFGRGENWT